MTSAFSWQNSISLCPASFCFPRPNLPVTPGVSWLPTFAFQSPIMKRTSFGGVNSKRSCLIAGNALGKCRFVVDNTPVCLVEMLGFGSGDFHHSSPGLIISSTLHADITDRVSSHFCIFQNVYKNHITANLCSTVLNFKIEFHANGRFFRKLKNSEPELSIF